jgi:peptidoglycan hydrolase-like protein with peptidoglycan-binding domain
MMAKAQFPLDGKQGKAWKVTSPFGYRGHPIAKVRRHHNGVDIWQAKEPSYLEACFDGKVVAVSTSVDPKGAGNKVVVQSTVMGKKVTWTYFHMVAGSIKVRVGQRIEAGTPVGKMGQTGFATGKHVHWEIWAGHLKSQPLKGFATGKGFYDPMKFTASAIEWERVNVEALEDTPEDAPVSVMPAHSVEPEVKVVEKPVEAPVAVVKVFVPLVEGSKGLRVRELQGKLGLKVDGVFGPLTEKAVKGFQIKHDFEASGVVDETTWNKVVG